MGSAAPRQRRQSRPVKPRTVVVCCRFCKSPMAKFSVSSFTTSSWRVKLQPGRQRQVWEETPRPLRPYDYRLRCPRSRCSSSYVVETATMEWLLVLAARAGERRATVPAEAFQGSRVPRVFDAGRIEDASRQVDNVSRPRRQKPKHRVTRGALAG